MRKWLVHASGTEWVFVNGASLLASGRILVDTSHMLPSDEARFLNKHPEAIRIVETDNEIAFEFSGDKK